MDFVNLDEALKKEKIADIQNILEIYSKTITLIGGESLTGKTITCLNFADNCISQDKRVIYVDTDFKPIINHPEPNLLNYFKKKNPEGYNQNFFYTTQFDEDEILQAIEEHHPSLLIIDSIYPPYMSVENPKQRAKNIKSFINELRDLLFMYQDMAVIITTQVNKEGRDDFVMLGGEGLKHFSDSKWIIDFKRNDETDKPSRSVKDRELRYFFIDKQEQIPVIIGFGGVIKKITRIEKKIGE